MTRQTFRRTINPMMKLGRPKKAAAEKRGTVLRLRLTRKEYKALCAAAKQAGLKVSAYARKLLAGGSSA